MSDLVTRCKRRADAEFATNLGDPEWKALISEMYAELHAGVVQAGWRYYENESSFTATGAASYALPTDTDSVVIVERVIDATSGRRVPLGQQMVQERARFTGISGDALAYQVIGQTVVLSPTAGSGTYVIVYIPQAADLSSSADTDTVDLFVGDGEAYLINGVAVKALSAKSDADVRVMIAEREAAKERFLADVQTRSRTQPARRVVMGTALDAQPYGFSDGFGGVGYDPGDWRWSGR